MNKDSHSTESAGFSTRCVHAGEELDSQGGIHAPLYNHSTFGFPNTEALLDVVEGRKPGNLYTRYGLNPTIQVLEKKLADLEGGDLALAFRFRSVHRNRIDHVGIFSIHPR